MEGTCAFDFHLGVSSEQESFLGFASMLLPLSWYKALSALEATEETHQ